MGRLNILLQSILLLLCLFLFSACGPAKSISSSRQEPHPLASLLVLPVDPVVSIKERSNEAKLTELQDGAAVMDELVKDYLNSLAIPNVSFLAENQLESYIGEQTGSRLSLAVKVARKMEKEAVLCLRLIRFSERQGNKYSVSTPASLSFEFRLVDARSGEMLCSGNFDESQESLFSNIFSFSGKKSFRWLQIREFAEDALRQKLDSCPVLKASRVR
jgi:hypothetical protein